jgi:tetratricopeptide (TPR) repeat protein
MKRVGWWIFLLVLIAVVLGGAGYGIVRLQQYWVNYHGRSFLLTAEAAMRARDTATAKRDLEICIRLAPDCLEAYLEMAAILRREGSADESQAILNQMVAANPTSPQAHVHRAGYLAANGKLEAAQADIAKALELAPDDRDGLLEACMLAAERGQFEVARQQSKRLLKLYPNHIPVYQWLGGFEASQGHPDEAIKWYRKGMEFAPDNHDLAWSLANILLDRGMVREAVPPTQVLLNTPEGARRAKYLDGRSEMALGHWVRASELFQELRPTLEGEPRYEPLLLETECYLGDSYGHTENHEQQLDAYRRAVKISPKSLRPHNAIFAALLLTSRIPDAIVELREIMKLPGAPAEAQLWLARLLLTKNLQETPAHRDWSAVDAAFQSAVKADRGSVQIPILHAEVLMARNRAAEAEKVLLDARRQYPKSLELWITLAALAGRQQDWKRVAQRLDEAQRNFGDSASLRLTRATLLLAQLGPGASQQLRKLAGGTEKLSQPEVLRLDSGLAMVAYHAQDYELAVQLCRQVCKLSPDDAGSRLLLLEVALRAPALANLDETLRQIESSEGRNARWQFGCAVQLRTQIRENAASIVEQALQHLAIARQLSPNWSSVPLLIGELEILRGDESAAVSNCLTAVYLGEHNPNIIHRLLSFLQGGRRYLDVDRVIRYVADRPIVSKLMTGRNLSRPGIAEELNDFSYVQESAEQAAAKSKEMVDQIWLAEVLEILGLRARREDRGEESQKLLARAESILRQAAAAQPGDPSVWAALVQFYVRTDQGRAAEEAVARARQALVSPRDSLSLAQLYQTMGKFPEAEQQYELTITGAENEYLMDRAADFYSGTGQDDLFQILLHRMITGKLPVPDRVLAWARRKRAWMLYQRNGRHDHEEALRLIAQNLASKQAVPQDQWIRVIVLAADKQRAGRQEAIRLLKAQPKLPPEQQYWLVLLYLGEGDWVSAREQFRHLLASQADKAGYVIPFTEALISKNELDEAEWWLSWLEKLVPDQFVTVRLRAAFLVRRARFDEAIALLRKFLAEPTAQAREKAVRQDAVAGSLEEFARTVRDSDHAAGAAAFVREAESLRRTLTKEYPEQRMALALLLAENKRLDEALTFMEESWRKAPVELIGRTAHTVFAADPDPKQLQRTEEVLRGALEKFDRPVSLLLVMARLRMTQHRFEEAESLLRESIGKEGNNVTCLASLALLLAHRHLYLDEALPLVQRAISVAGPAPELLDTRAMVYLALSQPAQARKDLDSAIAQKPNPLWYYHKAKVCTAMGDRKAAKEAMTRANQLGFRPELLHPVEKLDAPPAHKVTS